MTQFTPSIKQVDAGSRAKGDLKRAQSLAKEGRLEEALAEFEAVLKTDPSSYQAHLGAGNIKVRQRLGDEAIAHYQAACRIDPLKTQPYLRLGRIYVTLRQLDKALEQYNTVIKLDPKAPAGYVGAGQIYVLQEKYDQAIEQFKIALNYNPRLLPARRRLALAYAQKKDFAEAVNQLNAALRIDPQNSGTYVGIGRIHLMQKDHKSARLAFQEAIKVNPESPVSARLGLAECFLEEAKPADAAEVLSEMDLPKRELMKGRFHQLWGNVYYLQGLHREAIEEYRAAILNSGDDHLIQELGNVDPTQYGQDSEQAKAMAGKLKSIVAKEVNKLRDQDIDDD